jgi:hypothetical protein
MSFLKSPEISDSMDYERITVIEDKEKSVESFFTTCVIRRAKSCFRRSPNGN